MEQLLGINPWTLLIIALWTLPWKGIALWKSARSGDKGWFITLLLLQTFAVLEIVYIFLVSKRKEIAKEFSDSTGEK